MNLIQTASKRPVVQRYVENGLLKEKRYRINNGKEGLAISLDRQIHIYSFDTSAFYTDEEKALEVEINKHCSSK